jgi:hypothetical protein
MKEECQNLQWDGSINLKFIDLARLFGFNNNNQNEEIGYMNLFF